MAPVAPPVPRPTAREQALRHTPNIEGDEGLLESILSMQRP